MTIRNKSGEEIVKIDRGTAPVWSIAWNPVTAGKSAADMLAVTDWHQKLSFYQLSGKQIGKKKAVNFDPCCVSFLLTGDFVVMGGSDRCVSMWTLDGIKVGQICEQDSWIWSCKPRPNGNGIAVGSQDGTISMYQVTFNVVHGLYQDLYAYRDSQTNIVVQQLSTNNEKIHLPMRDHIKKLAVYRDRLAAQLTDRIVVFETHRDEKSKNELQYTIKEKINKKIECNLLVITSKNLVLCQEKRLQMLSFQGEKEREWHLEALIRYIKVAGGPEGREGLLVGLRNGQVLLVFLDNAFPVPLVKLDSCIRCLDLSVSRQKLAVIDDNTTCHVYDLRTKELLFKEPNASSVAWNTENEDMLCFSGNGLLSIKAGPFPCHVQKLIGFVVGFKGSQIYCLSSHSMVTVDVPQSASLDRYLDKLDFQRAYEIACLGVTDRDWRKLGSHALERLELDIARKAFIRLRDLKYLELIENIERAKMTGTNNSDVFLADIYAYQGKYHEV